MHALIAMYQAKDGSSASLMNGAGKPSTIIKAQECATVLKTTGGKVCEDSWLQLTRRSLCLGVPVIASLHAPGAQAWAAHAVCIVSVDTQRCRIGYKDPGHGDDGIVEQPYSLSGSGNDFFQFFYYGDMSFSRRQRQALNFYCNSLLFTVTPRMRGIGSALQQHLPQRALDDLVIDYLGPDAASLPAS